MMLNYFTYAAFNFIDLSILLLHLNKTPSFVDFYKFKYAEIIYLFVLINYF